jgi:hypothetical protein
MTKFTTLQKERVQELLTIHRMHPNATAEELHALGVTAEDEALVAEATRALASVWATFSKNIQCSLSTFAKGCRKATAAINAAALNGGAKLHG